MSREFAQRIFDVLRIRLSRKNRDYELGGILTELAQLLPANMLDENAHPLSFKEGERPTLKRLWPHFPSLSCGAVPCVPIFPDCNHTRNIHEYTTRKRRRNVRCLRRHAEQQFAEELEELKKNDTRQRPAHWEMSPWAVCTYLMGGKLENGFEVSPKYIGNRRIIEIAVATLATDRALLLYGVPGTAKSWVSEHLAAAISGDSTLIIQGTAGTSEEQMRYGWNYAELLSKGPSRSALVESPLMRAMSEGRIAVWKS